MNLELINLKKSFENKVLFENLSFKFSSTGIYAILGESGVGKTTLLRMIAGLDKIYEGEIKGGGVKNTSIAFQEHRLFPTLTALENAYLPNGDQNDLNLVNKAESLLLDLGFSVPDLYLRPTELSGGMRQRVSLARAFLRNAPILILDEPTKELDLDLRKKIYKYILRESQNRLVLIVSHNTEDFDNLNAVKINI